MSKSINLNKLSIQGNKKTILFAVVISALLASSVFAVMPQTNAKNFSGVIATYAYLNAAPQPVGLNQTVYISMWIDKTPATANGYYGDRWQNFTIKLTTPSGTTSTLGPYTSDAAGGAATTYVPTELGNYTMIFSFPGQTLTGGPGYPENNPPINNPSAVGNVYGASTSATVSFEVTSTPATITPENPLPTSYWERPIEGFNHLWYSIGGNWLGLGPIAFAQSGDYSFQGNFNPYTTAPLTAHVVWTKPVAAGGQMGGEFGGTESSVYFTGMEYMPKFAPVILNGVLYYTSYPGASTNPAGWIAVDLRTGQELWTKNTTDILLCGQIYNYVSLNQYGGIPYLWGTNYVPVANVNYYRGQAGILDMYDAMTGNQILTINNAPINIVNPITAVQGSDGSLIQYYVNTTNPHAPALVMWNSSLCILNSIPGYYDGQVTGPQWAPPQGGTLDYNSGIQWSMPLPTSYQGVAFPNDTNGVPINLAISQGVGNIGPSIDTQNNVIILFMNGALEHSGAGIQWQTGWQIEAGYSMTDGKQQWITNRTQTPDTIVAMGPAANGVYTEFNKETMTWMGYSALTGKQLWGPTAPYHNSLGYYNNNNAVIAYGNLYAWSFGGEVYCYNLTTGNLKWSWSTGSTGLDNPYGINPLWIIDHSSATIADGVFYVETGHNYGPPLFSGAKIYAINATTGQEIWEFLNFASTSSLPVVDGYMLSLNSYDNQIYCFGKGLTQTTVTTAPYANSNSKILITGTVTDQSPGQTCLGIPAAGTPAISDESMSSWMEYLYEQSPKPTNATGVQVTLTAIDPNGNYQTIGIITSDVNGQFSYTYTPPVPGAYPIIATFSGSNSYYSSSAQTIMGFEEAAATSSPQPTQAPSMADLYFLPAIIGIIVAIVVVGVATVLALRKHP